MNNISKHIDDRTLSFILGKLDKESLVGLSEKVKDYEETRKENPILHYKPWKSQLEFHNSSARTRYVFGGNRSGKTISAVAEIVFHTTRMYPDWYFGRRFNQPILVWMSAVTWEKIGEILAPELLGNLCSQFLPTKSRPYGFLPRSHIKDVSWRDKDLGIAKQILLKNGSAIIFKSDEQGRRKFEGTGISIIHFDEEHSKDVVDECNMRIITSNGIIIQTLTPGLNGYTWIIRDVFDRRDKLDKYEEEIFFFDSRENPYLSRSQRKSLINAASLTSAGDTRVTGIPNFNIGLIYPWYSPEKLKMDVSNIVTDGKLNGDWVIFGGGDTSGSSPPIYPFVIIWFAINKIDGSLVVLDQFYSRKRMPVTFLVECMKKSIYYNYYDCVFPDPLAGQVNIDLSCNDVRMGKTSNDVRSGTDRIDQLGISGKFFISDKIYQDYLNASLKHDNLDFSIEMMNYKNGLNGMPVKVRDHGPDAIRYGKMGVDLRYGYLDSQKKDRRLKIF